MAPSRPQVFTIPPAFPFARALAAGVIARSGADPLALGDAMVLVPTRRAARALRDAFSDALGGAALLLSTGAAGVPASTSGAEGGAAATLGFFLHPLSARAMVRQTSAVILIIWRVPGGTIQIRAPVGRKMQGNDEWAQMAKSE